MLPKYPSTHSETHELADFAEWLCWVNGSVSKRKIVAYLGRIDDNDNNEGCNDDDDLNSDFLDKVINEIGLRELACGGGYPFHLCLDGTVLRYNEDNNDHRSILYRYLLLSTRLNMKVDKVHAGIDGTQLLEKISAHALKNYIGGTRARAIVFGTAVPGNFQKKIDALCHELHEGGGFRKLGKGAVKTKDDKLDIAAWAPFSDSLPGQLIIFGQCKTGTNWRDSAAQLQPVAFVKKWMNPPILVDPIRAFCISEAADRSRWNETCIDAGILMDRCRLVDFCDNIEPELFDRVRNWTLAAKNSVAMEGR